MNGSSAWHDGHAADSMDQRVLTEQVAVLYRYLLPVLAVNLIVGCALIYGLWGVLPHTHVTAWAAALVVLVCVRVWSWMRHRRDPAPERTRHHALAFTIGAGLSGVLWGAAGVVFFDWQSLEYQLFIVFVLAGMGAGAVSSLTVYLPAFLAYFPISVLPNTLMLALHGGSLQTALAIMTLAYVGGLCLFGYNLNRSLVQSWRLRFENIDLVQELSVQKVAAERADAAKSRFLAAASHDLRQPLHALTLFVSALDERIRYPEVRRIVDNIKASSRALEDLFNALLDVSRLDAGVLKPDVQSFPLAAVLGRIRHDFEPSARAKGLQFACPAPADYLHSDPVLVEQILRNYVSNAIRHTGSGGIEVACERRGESVRVSVIDTGCGIPKDQQESIFKEFYQLGNPERDRTKGLGLGLAIVARLATLLDHPIAVASQPGKGARFSVDVPLGDPAAAAQPQAPVPDSASPDVRGLTVLVVDDDMAAREGLRELLTTWQCTVYDTSNLDEVRQALANDGSIDAIIADYRLRDRETGVQVIETVHRSAGRRIPALLITGESAVDRLKHATASGFQLLHKPVEPAKLRAFLRFARRHAQATP